jgi:nucleotide-binding universal stress UspA family protein
MAESQIRKVLAATDGSEHGLSAVVTGAAFSRRAGARFEVVTVVEVLLLPPTYAPPDVDTSEFEPEFVKEARERAEAQAREADAAGAPVHVRAGLAAQLVNKVAEESGADLIVVGATPQPALARTLVGSTGRRIVYLADRPVLVADRPRREPFRRVLAAVDLSEASGPVLEAAWAVARAEGAALRALYVMEPLPMMLARVAAGREEERRRQGLRELERVLEATGLAAEPTVEPAMREGHSGRGILEEAQSWDADLVVLGTHGFGFFHRLLLGSTSLHVLRHGQRATLIVPRPRDPEEAGARAES